MTPPSCPDCAIPMARVHGAQRGEWWGCVLYPHCLRTLDDRQVAVAALAEAAATPADPIDADLDALLAGLDRAIALERRAGSRAPR